MNLNLSILNEAALWHVADVLSGKSVGPSCLTRQAQELLDALQQYARQEIEAPTMPIIVRYEQIPDLTSVIVPSGGKSREFGFISSVYKEAFTENHGIFAQWFERAHRDSLLEHPFYPELIPALNRVISRCFGFTLGMDHPASVVVAGSTPVSALPKALQQRLAIVADIAMRCIRLNPQFGENAGSKTPGVVILPSGFYHYEFIQSMFPLIQVRTQAI